MSARAIAAIVIVIALGVIGFVVFMQGPSQSGSTPIDNGQNANAARNAHREPVMAGAASQKGNSSRKPTHETPKTDAGTPGNDEDPIIVLGKVNIPSGITLDSLEIEVHDAAGELAASGEPNPGGTFEVRYGRALLPGWTVRTTWAGVTAPEGAKGPAPTGYYAPAFQRIAAAHAPTEPPVTCDLTIGPQPTIVGIVISRATGKPVEGATIAAIAGMGPWKDQTEETTETDADGKYRLALEEMPSHGLMIICKTSDKEYQAKMSGPLDLMSGETRNIDFQLDGLVKFSGRVVDDSNNQPIAHATVNLVTTDYGFSFDHESVRTDANGQFEIEGDALPLDHAIIKVDAKGFAPAVRPANPESIAEIRLGKSIIVIGRVKTADGKGLQNTRVIFSLPHEWNWSDLTSVDTAKTDGEGNFHTTLSITPADEAVVFVDYEPLPPFLATLKSLQTKNVTSDTREIEIVIGGGTASRPAK